MELEEKLAMITEKLKVQAWNELSHFKDKINSNLSLFCHWPGQDTDLS